MINRSELSHRLCALKRLSLGSIVAVMLAAPCLAESEWPPTEVQDQILTVNPEDLQPQSFESSPPADIPVETPAAAEAPPEVPLPEESQPTMETPAEVPAETAPAETPAETPAVPPDAAIEAPPEDPAEAPPVTEPPAAAEAVPEGTPPQFSGNPIITVPEDPPPALPEP